MKGSLLMAGFLACLGSAVRAQTTLACRPFSSVDSSAAWLTAVSRQPLPQQVAALRGRIACDAHVHDPSRDQKVCLMGVSAENQRLYARRQADPRPIGVTLLYVVDGRTLLADSVARLRQLVTANSVKTIDF